MLKIWCSLCLKNVLFWQVKNFISVHVKCQGTSRNLGECCSYSGRISNSSIFDQQERDLRCTRRAVLRPGTAKCSRIVPFRGLTWRLIRLHQKPTRTCVWRRPSRQRLRSPVPVPANTQWSSTRCSAHQKLKCPGIGAVRN